MNDEQAFFLLFDGLPRQGPGTDDDTRWLLERLPPGDRRRVLDLGCGTGASALVLAQCLPDAVVTAADTHAPYLETLEREARSRGIASRIVAVRGSMIGLSIEPGSIDLIWSEGAIYQVGFEAGLRAWRGWLAKGGLVVVSELCWHAEPSERAARFWASAYPDITTRDGNEERAARAGYTVVDRVDLRSEAWWRDYYRPLRARMRELAEVAAREPALQRAIDETEREIALFEACSTEYGYTYFVLR